jgi:hypothetical protein
MPLLLFTAVDIVAAGFAAVLTVVDRRGEAQVLFKPARESVVRGAAGRAGRERKDTFKDSRSWGGHGGGGGGGGGGDGYGYGYDASGASAWGGGCGVDGSIKSVNAVIDI